MAGFRAALARGVATVKDAAWTRHMTGRQRRVTFRYVAAYTGDLAAHPKTGDGVMVQGRTPAGAWEDIALLPAWKYRENVAEGASITDVGGTAFTAVADGGWRDLTVTVPDAITGLRLQPRATMEPGASVSSHGFKYDFALRADHICAWRRSLERLATDQSCQRLRGADLPGADADRQPAGRHPEAQFRSRGAEGGGPRLKTGLSSVTPIRRWRHGRRACGLQCGRVPGTARDPRGCDRRQQRVAG